MSQEEKWATSKEIPIRACEETSAYNASILEFQIPKSSDTAVSKEDEDMGRDGQSDLVPCFWTAWNSHRDYLMRLSMMWMNISASDAEDALSVATIRAYEKYKDHADQIVNERAWFARLLHNICIDLHRANSRRFRLNEKVKEVVEMDGPGGESSDLDPEEEMMNSQLGGAILGAINSLPDKLRLPIIMRLIQGEDYDHIANTLGITNDNARKRVQQARAILRRQLSSLR